MFPVHAYVNGACTCPSKACGDRAGKHPIVEHGLKQATTDERTIAMWWGRWPWANIGVATGADSGIVVVDIDVPKGGDVSLAAVEEEKGPLPETMRARTGGGGWHHVYRHPGVKMPNAAGRLPGFEGHLEGIDFRGDGGYVVVAPSNHRSGGVYAWDNKLDPAPAPGWLRPADPPSRGQAEVRELRAADGKGTPYGVEALRRELEELRLAPSGTRNACLNIAAFSLGQLVAAGQLSEALVRDELDATAHDIGLDDGEIRKTIDSGIDAGKRQPRDIQDRRPEWRPRRGIDEPPDEPEPPEWLDEGEPWFIPHRPPPGEVQARERSSYWPRSFDAMYDQPVPTLLRREDGVCLLYPGRVHALIGESESGKSWVALVAAVEVIQAGGRVLYIDYEDNEATCATRLMALGVSMETIIDRVTFVAPDEPYLDKSGRYTVGFTDLGEVLETWPPALAILDGVTEAMALDSFDPLDNAAIAAWYRLPRRIAHSTGATTVVIDHVVKDKETRGRWAIGGQHKLAGLDGAAYSLDVIDQMAPCHTGRIRVTVSKDRTGKVRKHATGTKAIGEIVFNSKSDTDMRTLFLEPGGSKTGDSFEPTGLMEKVSRRLEINPGESKNALRSLGKAEYVDIAIDKLLGLGHVRVERVGQSKLHYSISPYRAPDEEG